MAYWWLDRALPGIVASLIMTGLIAASHILLRRHINRVTRRQNAYIDGLTAAQTAALSGKHEHPEGTS